MKTHTLSTSKFVSQISAPFPSGWQASLGKAIPRRVLKRWSRRILLVALMLISLSAAAAFIGCDGQSSTRNPGTTDTIIRARFLARSK